MNDRLLPPASPSQREAARQQAEAHDRAFADHYVTLSNGNKVSRSLLKLLGYGEQEIDAEQRRDRDVA